VAEAICRSLPASVWPVGVFVNQPYREIIGKVRRCGLRAVQLHGQETPELVQALGDDGVLVIKTLFANANPFFDAVRQYAAHAYLVECAGERLPGGNAKSWDWSAASGLVSEVPVMLAGGLTPENVAAAIQAARPAAVDVSSGVERIPGQKDLTKVKLFIEAVQQNGCSQTVGEVFP
jgi:phosphoribosylanthranilate isomerase